MAHVRPSQGRDDVVGFGVRRFQPASAGLLTVPRFAWQERLPDGPM